MNAIKKFLAVTSAFLLLTGAFLSTDNTDSTIKTKALEAATITELQEQTKLENENAFPDPDASYRTYEDGALTFHLYDEFAVLEECTDREVTEITIPDTADGLPVVGIAGTPFGYCRKLTKLTLPDTLEHFDWWDLVSTTLVRLGSDEEPLPSVSEVVVSESNPYYTVQDGLLYSKDMKTLFGCPPALDIKSVALPEETERIGDYAFAASLSLETAILPDTVTHIHNAAFAACVKLRQASLPETITSISGDMFYLCESLSEVTLRGKVEKIGYGAFAGCKALTEFTIPETVTVIGYDSFAESGCVETIDGVHYVGSWAVGSDEDITEAKVKGGTLGIAEASFSVRSELSYLEIPSSVKYVGDLCYSGLSSGAPSVVRYGAPYIGEKTIAAAKNMTDIYILDPKCEIFDGEKTIPAKAWKVTQQPDDPDISGGGWITLSSVEAEDSLEAEEPDIVIHGYVGSTAEAYAEKYDRKFVPIAEEAATGDLNGDGVLGMADAVSLGKWLLGDAEMTFADWKAADFNADGALNVIDFTLMKQRLLQPSETK